MGRRVIEQITDDLTGEPLDAEDAVTIEFSVGNKSYSLDLSKKHAEEFHKALEKYTSVAAKVGGRAAAKAPRGRKTDLAAVRAWAEANGYKVAARGRISAEIQEAYDKAN